MAGRLVLQRFDPSVLALREVWQKHAIAPGHEWVRIGENEGSESGPFDVEDQEKTLGKAKPGYKNPNVSRAAHEKIASDLAALLDMPVPPVTLFELKRPLPHDARRNAPGDPHICVSAWAFPQCDPWCDRIVKKMTQSQLDSVTTPMSAMWAFESWISAEDRGAKHILVNTELGSEPVGLAFIDYAFSMSKFWNAPNSPAGATQWRMPIESSKKVPDVVECVAQRIQHIDDERISEIVARIPTPWLPEERRRVILDNLLGRKVRMRQLLGLAS